MRKNDYFKLNVIFLLIFYLSCNETIQDPYLPGCTDSDACNYDSSANKDDGSCYDEMTIICYHDEDGDGYYIESQEYTSLFCDASCADLGDTWSDDDALGPEPKVTLSASPSSILVGDSLLLDVNVVNIENLYAISFQLTFDSSILEIDMVSGIINYSTFINGDFGPVVVLNSDGMLSVALGGNNINGKIFSVTIQGLQSGSTNAELNEVNLIQDNGQDVSNYSSISFESVNITVD